MASSYTNLFKEPTVRNNKSDRLTETSDEKHQDNLSPHLVEKRTFASLAAPFTHASSASCTGIIPHMDDQILRARPFEVIAITQPTDASSESSTKSKDDGSK